MSTPYEYEKVLYVVHPDEDMTPEIEDLYNKVPDVSDNIFRRVRYITHDNPAGTCWGWSPCRIDLYFTEQDFRDGERRVNIENGGSWEASSLDDTYFLMEFTNKEVKEMKELLSFGETVLSNVIEYELHKRKNVGFLARRVKTFPDYARMWEERQLDR